ncbi:MAG: cation diffusion facilitator family transporter, partial [Deltaproteobacteria bacterium]|nr:cation diffusion facilitator family transporter [Deltaproteobacteria bacterium]
MKHNCYIIENEISVSKKGSRRILLTLLVTVVICLIEFAGGIISGSNALIADAGHMLADSASLFVCYFASLITLRRSDSNKTFGYFRAEILASLINGTLLISLAVFVIFSAIRRYFEPVGINGTLMLIVSSVGLIANIAGILLLKGLEANLNIKGALLHIIGDTLSSAGVVVGSVIIILTGYLLIDSVLSIIIGFVILYNAMKLIKDASDILMESVPHGVKMDEIKKDIEKGIEGVNDIHDIHIWSISSQIYIFTAHIVTDKDSLADTDRIL